MPLQQHGISFFLGRIKLTDRVYELIGDLVAVLIDDHRIGDALAREASELE